MRLGGRIAGALLGLSLVLTALPAAALVEIDPNNPPPWPKRHIGQNDMPSRYDKAPVGELVAAADGGENEAGVVLRRRQRARDEAVLAWARDEAGRNNTRAMVMLGDMLAKAEPLEAMRLYRAAADLGDTRAMNALAGAYLSGEMVERNAPEAMRLYTLAAEKGDDSAIVSLINLYRAGVAVPRDLEAAARWEEVRRDMGVKVIVQAMDFPPRPVPVDKAPLRAAAEAGDPVAMRKLAAAYDADYSDKAAPAETFRWYKAAAEKGDAAAMFGLGQAYRSGRAVPRDPARGVEWLLKAARAGDVTAMHNLGRMYTTGEDVKADPEQAKYWQYQTFWAPDAR